MPGPTENDKRLEEQARRTEAAVKAASLAPKTQGGLGVTRTDISDADKAEMERMKKQAQKSDNSLGVTRTDISDADKAEMERSRKPHQGRK